MPHAQTTPTYPFDLPPYLAEKTHPTLIAKDQEHFALIAQALEKQRHELHTRLETQRRSPGTKGQEAVERDVEIRRLESRLKLFARYSLDLCLGRLELAPEQYLYIGRAGLSDGQGQQLLIDWRTPAAAPFFAATAASPLGALSRRRYRWSQGGITDYWDEKLSLDAHNLSAAADAQSAFLSTLAESRTPRMREVLGTIASDQDTMIRAGSKGALVVDGGPGTGKTVVALHRAAYLLYADAQLARDGGGVLFVGPSPSYLRYVDDVLPGLGEDSVQLCTPSDLVAQVLQAPEEKDPAVAQFKGTLAAVKIIENAVKRFQRPPRVQLELDTAWGQLSITPYVWRQAFAQVEPQTPHNDARQEAWDALAEVLAEQLDEIQRGEDQFDEDQTLATLKRFMAGDEELSEDFNRAWPLLDPTGLVADLLSNPGFLQRCAPELTPQELELLLRSQSRDWTQSDLPLLDAALALVGNPLAEQQRSARQRAINSEREAMNTVVDQLIAAEDDMSGLVTMLRQEELADTLIDEAQMPQEAINLLDGPFGHIIVDEAQELSDAQWLMLLRRCPSGSFTIVGDRAQARQPFSESWQDRLERVGLANIRVGELRINYRTPSEIMAVAEPTIRAVLPHANVPVAIRSSGQPVRYGKLAGLGQILESWLAENHDGVAVVIGDPAFTATDRVESLPYPAVKGLEFDLAILVDPQRQAGVDSYVAMTRATRELVILTS